jgi:flagellin
MRELAVQAANDTYNTAQRTAISTEITQLSADITRIANATQFNGKTLLDGSQSAANAFVLQIGANSSTTNDVLDISSSFATSTSGTALGLTALALDVSSGAGARTMLTAVDAALTTIGTRRGLIGAFVNRLQGASNNLSIAVENFSASESRIRDVDVAMESAKLTRNQILQQASSAMLAQANQAPSLAMQLLQG